MLYEVITYTLVGLKDTDGNIALYIYDEKEETYTVITSYSIHYTKLYDETLNQNIKSLKINDNYEIIKNSYEEALKNFKNRNIKFDIIFLDPPYKLDYIVPTIKLVSEYNLMNEDGLIICEYENEEINIDEYELIKERKYGSKKIKIYKK